MLFLDQPVQTGLSYDSLSNVTVSVKGSPQVADFTNGTIPEQNTTFYVGTLPSQNANFTTQGSMNSARAMWHFAQIWFQEFPEHKPNNDRISIATESYGGRYGPAFATFFQQQNEKIRKGTWNETGETHILHIDTLFLINSCIDRLVQWPGYPKMMFNNTYGLQTVNQSIYDAAVDALYREGGCVDQIYTCHNLSRAYDPTNQGFNASVSEACQNAESFCISNVRDMYSKYSERNYYDISAINPAAFPQPFYEGWLNQPHVQQDLGLPLNFSQGSEPVASAFHAVGDYNRPGWKEDLAYLLESGIKVTLVYGDRDFACNWYGGELLSLAIDYEFSQEFHAAGYTPVIVNETYIGGQVRQYGNLSFTRVYQAGHEVPAYQPETAYKIFTRALFNKDVATGKVDTANCNYSTEGPSSTEHIKNEALPMPAPTCYVLSPRTCTNDQWESVNNGTALIKNWIVVDNNTKHLFPDMEGNQSAPTRTAFATADFSTESRYRYDQHGLQELLDG